MIPNHEVPTIAGRIAELDEEIKNEPELSGKSFLGVERNTLQKILEVMQS